MLDVLTGTSDRVFVNDISPIHRSILCTINVSFYLCDFFPYFSLSFLCVSSLCQGLLVSNFLGFLTNNSLPSDSFCGSFSTLYAVSSFSKFVTFFWTTLQCAVLSVLACESHVCLFCRHATLRFTIRLWFCIYVKYYFIHFYLVILHASIFKYVA